MFYIGALLCSKVRLQPAMMIPEMLQKFRSFIRNSLCLLSCLFFVLVCMRVLLGGAGSWYIPTSGG